MSKPTVILADDHAIVLEGLKGLLQAEFEIVGIANDGRELLSQVECMHPDIIVVDITMPLLNGIDAIRHLARIGVKAKIIVLTMHRDATYAKEAFDAGACGFVLKHSASSELITSMHEALRGNTFVSPIIAGELMRLYKEEPDRETTACSQLTARQRDVLRLLAEGRSAKEVADLLQISTRTVESHKYSMMQELHITTNAELVRFAIKQGLISV
jgi:DNA-binding NarL/FixJ family response regulator